MSARVRDEIRIGVLAGVLSGFAGALLFAAAHAVLIVPIWDRMGSGLIFGPLAGAIAGWALAELTPGYLTMPTGRAAITGAVFGATLFLLVAPVTAADLLLRATGIAPRFELVAVAVAVILAVGAGAAFGSYRTRTRRGMMAGALATLSLTIAMAGPVPIGRSSRALGIFLAVLPVTVVAGALLVLIARGVNRLRGPRAEPISRSDRDDAGSAIRSLAGDLTHRWLQTGEIPEDGVEGTVPALRELLGGGMELSFDDFQHKHYVRPDWGFAQLALPEFPSPLELYLPTSWRIEPTGEPGVAIVVDQAGNRRQVLQVAGPSQYGDAVDAALYGGDLLGFEVGRDYRQFIHWRFVAARPDGYDVWSIFDAGDQALVTLGEAADVEELKVQLTSSANSIPWHHWIEFVKNADA